MTVPIRRSTRMSMAYDNHHSSDVWSSARYTDVLESNSSTFVVRVNMDTVAFDIADKFDLPAVCSAAKMTNVKCGFGSGITCNTNVGRVGFGVLPSSSCLSPLFPEGPLFPPPPLSSWWGAPSA